MDTVSIAMAPKNTHSFYFSRNSVTDCTIYQGCSPMYALVTSRNGGRTDVCNIPQKQIIATLKRSDFFSDKVKFTARNDGKSIAIAKWLTEIKLPNFIENLTSLVTDSGNYVWKSDRTFRLGLFSEEDSTCPVAYTLRELDRPERLVLHMSEAHEDMVEDILVSFIVLEQRLRLREKKQVNGILYGPVSTNGFI